MPWEIVIDSTTGRLVSSGGPVADPLPAGLEVVTLPSRPPPKHGWNPRLRRFVKARQPIVRTLLDTARDDAEAKRVIDALSLRDKMALEAAIEARR